MSELTHAEATEMLLWANLSPAERSALRDHLSRCPTCRHNAAVHSYLARELPRQMPYSANQAAFRARFLRKVQQVERRKQWAGPLSALASTAVLALLLTVGWLLWSLQQEQDEILDARPESVATGERPAFDVTPAASFTAEPTPLAQGSVITASVPAPSLQGAIIEETAEQTVAIYLPPSYNQSDQRFPVVYWLATGDGPTEGPYGIGDVQKVMDDLLATGEVQEMIVVVPPLHNSYGFRVLYHNSPVSGNWADFLAQDVVSYVDANLRTIADPGARGLGGAVFTASNALEITMLHPGTFGALYLKHPLIFAPGALEDSFLTSRQTVRRVTAIVDELAALSLQSAQERYLEILLDRTLLYDHAMTLIYGMAYAPNNSGHAPYFDYLYLSEDERAPDDVWARWEQGYGEIPEKVARYSDALRQLNGLYLEYSPQNLTAIWSNQGIPYLAQQLEQQGVPFILETYIGSSHLDTIPRLRQAMFPFFSETLEVSP